MRAGRTFRGGAVLALALPLAAGLAAIAAQWLAPSLLVPVERFEYDLLLRTLAPPDRVDQRIVLVLYDERSVEAAGRIAAPRHLHAELTRSLRAAGVGRIAWDALFDRPTAEDAALADAMRTLPTFIAVGTVPPTAHGASAAAAPPLAARFAVGPDLPGEDWPVPPAAAAVLPQPPLLEAAAGVGHVMATVDGDGILRRVPLVISVDGRHLPSLALRAGLDALGVPPEDLAIESGWLVVGARTLAAPLRVPLDGGGNALLAPVREWRRRFDVRSYDPLLRSVRDFPEEMREGLEGRTVVVGVDYLGSGDFVAVPSDPVLPGVVVTATLLNALLTGEFVRTVPRALASVLTLAAAIAVSLVFAPRRPRIRLLACGCAALAVLSATLFRQASLFLPVAVPLLVAAIPAFVLTSIAHAREHAGATRLAQVLERFVSPALLREIDRRGVDGLAGSVARAEVTVLFADVAGFTSFADRSEPEDVAAMLGRFYRAALDIVDAHGGTLDKLLGDGVLAYWGAPDPCPEKERRALGAALALQAAFAPIAREWAARGAGALALRCGLTTSFATCGYLGDERRAAYTVVGRGVNLAARLQAAAEPGGCLADARTVAAAGAGFCCAPRGRIELKGVKEPVEVFVVQPGAPQG